LSEREPRKARMHALWAMIGSDTLTPRFHQNLLNNKDAGFRAWGVRAAGNFRTLDGFVRDGLLALTTDPSPDVRLQMAIAASKLTGVNPLPLLLQVLSVSGDDKLIPPIAWQNLHPLLDRQILGLELVTADLGKRSALGKLLPRVVDRLLDGRKGDPNQAVAVVDIITMREDFDPEVSRACLAAIASKVQNGEVSEKDFKYLHERLQPLLSLLFKSDRHAALYVDAALVATTFKDPEGIS